jgi:AcrR family transcriptional regulator
MTGPHVTPRPRRAARSGDRDAQILDAATRIFQERGYDATTIQAIADEVGLLKGSLYHYIDTKEDLLFRIIDDVHRRLAKSASGVSEDLEPLERIRTFIEGHVRFCAENLPAIRVFLHDFRALSEERRETIVKERDAYNRRFHDLLRDAQVHGHLKPDLDLDLVVLAVFGMMNWMHHWYQPGGRKSADDIAQTFAALALDGMRR